MDLTSLQIDPTPVEPAVDPDVINFDLYRHNTLSRQYPGYIGSATHAQIRERLAKQNIHIK